MAGYTRQSAPDIINGAEITAPPLIAEFNQIEAGFSGVSGHSHDGTAGNAPPINLQTSVSGYLLPINGGTGGKNNNTATANPTLTDDVNAGYAPGNIWLNTTTGRFFVCASNTASAAVWNEVVGVDSATSKIYPETTNTVDIGSTTNRYKDLYLSGSISGTANATFGGTLNVTGTTTLTDVNATGNATVGGTLGVTGLTTLAQVDANSGTIDNTVIGGNTASPITGTTITSTNGFTGDITGDVTGNVTAATGTSSFTNINASGTITGNVTGDITGNITAATGTSSFNDVTISGTLNMDGNTTATIQNLTDPTNPQDAATKNYVDVGLANLVDTAPAALDTLNELAAAINDDANFSTTMTNALAGKVADTGDTMTGDLIMSGATVTGLPLPTANTEAASKAYTDQQDALQVSRSGDTMSGQLNMGSNKITNLATPTAATDAASKGYTDGILGSATAASASAAAAATSEANAAVSEANAATHAATAQTAITTSQQFLDTYFVSTTAPSGSNLTVGDLWFDTTNNIMMVYGSGGFQNAGSSVNGTSERSDYVVGTSSGSYTGSTTTFPATYDAGYVDVYLNGVKLAPSDFTATTGTNIVLGSAAATGDIVAIVGYGTFQLADHYSRTASDARYAQLSGATFTGDISGTNATLSGYLRGPSSFTIDPATHEDNTGTVVIAGNLQVDGTTTTINSTTLTVDDLNVVVASGAADAAAANGAGLTVDGANATFNYAATGDKWTMNKLLDVTGGVNTTDDIRIATAPNTTRRVYALGGTGPYVLNSTGGAAIAFNRDASNNDEIAFETHAQGAAHAERMRIGNYGQLGFNGANYGTSGQVLTSNGSTAAPSWQTVGFTTNVVTTSSTASANNHYYLNAATVTLTLPASPSVGDEVRISEVAGNTDCVIGRNGSNIMGDASDLTIDTAYLVLSLRYVDATIGWAFS